MKVASHVYRRLRNLWRRKQLDADMAEEMLLHLELQTEEYVAAGMSPKEARWAAARAFGNLEGVKDICRDQRGWSWLHDLIQDVQFAWRQLRRASGFSLAAILTMALGIGACTILFSIVNAVLFRPYEYPNPDHLVVVYEKAPQEPNQMLATSAGLYFDLKAQSTTFTELAAFYGESALLEAGGETTSVIEVKTTPNCHALCGFGLVLGRFFTAAEGMPGHNGVAILSVKLWQTRFRGNPGIINQTILLNEQPYTVIGVVRNPAHPESEVVATPTNFASRRHDYDHKNLAVIGRLRPHVTLSQAAEEYAAISRYSARLHPELHQDREPTVAPLREALTNPVRRRLYVLWGAGGFLLLIACVNVANLMLTQSSARQKELSIRSALGAGRGRLVRLLLSEGLMISGAGGILGTLAAVAAMGPLARFAANSIPRIHDGTIIDGTVLLFAGGLVLLSSLAIGLIPSIRLAGAKPAEELKDAGPGASTGRRQRSLRNVLVVGEIALGLTLLTCSGLLLRTLRAMQSFDQGLQTRNVHGNTFKLLPPASYDTPDKILTFTDQVLAKCLALPGTAHAAMATGLPMSNGNMVPRQPFALDGKLAGPGRTLFTADFYKVTPQYFAVMTIPVLEGRAFGDQDGVDAPPVMIINREMARQCFPDRNPLGQKITLAEPNQPGLRREIVGVVGNVKPRGPLSPTGPQIYIPFAQSPAAFMTLMLRVKGPDPATLRAVPEIIHSIDPDLDFLAMYDYESTVARSWAGQDFNFSLMGSFAGLALLLSIVGVYGVMAYAVDQRRHEIGLRMAFGATPRQIVRMVVGEGLHLILLGMLVGTGGALLGAKSLESLLFQVSPYDLFTYGTANLLLLAVTLFACWLPARRAAAIDPMQALRHE